MSTQVTSRHGLTYPDLARILGTALISTGLGLLLFVTITVTWGDPFTRISERGAQRALDSEFELVAPEASDLSSASLDPALTQRAAIAAKRSVKFGKPAGRISIPKIDVRKVFVHGARDGTPDLTKGPGLYQDYPFPGTGAPFAIAGHRTTYGAPFLDIDRLGRGDVIVLTVPYGQFTYTVMRKEIIGVRDWSILEYGAAERTSAARARVARTRKCVVTCEHLVLTACHPKYSASHRIAVLARLTKVKLVA